MYVLNSEGINQSWGLMNMGVCHQSYHLGRIIGMPQAPTVDLASPGEREFQKG